MSSLTPPDYDVAIVGAGPVGLVLATLLAEQGVRIVVLEARETHAERARAIGIHPPGLAVLDRAGLGEAVRALAARINVGIVCCGQQVLLRHRLDRAPVLCLAQDIVAELAENRVRRLAPGSVHRGAEVTNIRPAATHVTITYTAAGRRSSLRARYVVGADGLRSTVRAAIGSAWLRQPGGGHYAMADARARVLPDDAAFLYLEPAGVVESFPLPDGSRRWVLRLGDEDQPAPAAPSVDAFAALVHARTGRALDPTRMTPPSPFTARQHLADAVAIDRVALVGDAAHEVSPIGGQGMNLGWIDAHELAAALVAELAGAPTGVMLQRYSRRRSAAARSAMRKAAFNMAMGAPVRGPRLHARNTLTRMLAVPPLRSAAAAALTMRIG